MFYLIPGHNMSNGLTKVVNDKDVLEMTVVAMKYRCVESDDSDESDAVYDPKVDKGKGVSDEDIEEDSRFDNEEFGGIINEDEGCDTDLELELLNLQLEEEENGELQFDSENSDDEYNTAKERVRVCNSKLLEEPQHRQREAAQGKLGSKDEATEGEGAPSSAALESDYEDSEEYIDTLQESQDKDGNIRRRSSALLVSPTTDFSKFKWKVGLKFAKREDFRGAVNKYAVFQGRNLIFTTSNKRR